jgi:S1-C subfamily serine protease
MRTPALALALLLGAVPAAAQEVKAAGGDAAAETEELVRRAAERAAPSVAAIRVDREPEEEPRPSPRPFPAPLGGLMGGGVFARRPAGAWCSGTVVEAEGTIVTTHFNVSGRVKSIRVRLGDGRELEGKLMASNATYDLAAIKVEAENLPVLALSRMETLRTGATLLALGRAPDGKGITVNPGILSSPSRLAGRGIQTDARLNFGNVGGPLVDLEGRLVAITCKVDVKYASDRGQNSGVGFAIPHDRFRDVLAELKAGRSVLESRRAFLGVRSAEQSEETDGFPVAEVVPASAAERAGMKNGDVVTEIDGRRIRNFDDLRAAISRKNPGDRIRVKVRRGEEALEMECELGWTPD